MTTIHVTQLMNRPPVTCDVGDSLQTAASLMWEHDCGIIPVVDNGRLAGVITDRDICMAALTQGRILGEIPVTRVMATDVVSCRDDEPLEAVERRMSERQIRRLPVVDRENHPIGVLSLSDIARRAATSREGEGAKRGLVQTLSAICQPRVPQRSATRPAK